MEEIKTVPLTAEERKPYETWAGMGSGVRRMVEHTERLIAEARADERAKLARGAE